MPVTRSPASRDSLERLLRECRVEPVPGILARGRALVRGRTVREFCVRSAQLLAALSEQFGLSADVRSFNDAAFFRKVDSSTLPHGSVSAAGLLDHFRRRDRPRFFLAFDQRAAVVRELRARWPPSEGATLDRANRILAGGFDLLGRTNLSFGRPIDWRLDPVSGKRTPLRHWRRIQYLNPAVVGDPKIIWELNRHQYLTTLGKAYWFAGDERYAEGCIAHLVAWIGANPPALGINWVSSLEVAFRAISWIWALHFLKESPSLTPEVFLQILKSLYLHGRHVETFLSTYSSPNTHLTGEALGLVYLGTLFPEFKRAARWRRTGWRILLGQLGRHVGPDGVYFERSTYYHRYTTDLYLHARILGELNGVHMSAWARAQLRALLDHLLYVTKPDGATPLLGDDDGGRLVWLDERAPNDFRPALATGAVLYSRPDYRYVAGAPAEDTLWLLGTEGPQRFDRLEATPPASTSRAFQVGGYFVMRDGWTPDTNYLVIDCGPHGVLNCGHAHADALAFELVARGRSVLIDPGTHTYTGSLHWRSYFRSSAAHTTLTIDGESSSLPGGPFSWRHIARASLVTWTSRKRLDYFEGVHDGYARLPAPAVHRRSILFLKGDYWIVRDTVVSDGEHGVELRFHLAPGIALQIASPTVATALWGDGAKSSKLMITTLASDGSFWREEGWAAPEFGRLLPTPVCVFSGRSPRAPEFVTFLIPWSGDQHGPRVAEVPAQQGRAFTVDDGPVHDVVLTGAGQLVESGRFASDGKWAWMRTGPDGTCLREAVLLDGQRLTVGGRTVFAFPSRVECAVARVDDAGLQIDTMDAALDTVPSEEG